MGRRPAREGAASAPRPERRRRRRNQLGGGTVSDVELHRRQHAVPRAAAVGPGADGLRAEQRRPGSFRDRRPGRPALVRRAHVPARRRRRTPTPATSRTPRWPASPPAPGMSVAQAAAGGAVGEPDADPAPEPAAAVRDRLPAAAPRAAVAGRLLRGADRPADGDLALRPRGSLEAGYAMTWSFANYLDALSGVRRAVPPVAGLRRHRHRAVPAARPTRWPTRSPSGPAAGATCCWSRSSRRSSPAS